MLLPRLVKRGVMRFVAFCIALLSLHSVTAAEVDLLRMGKYRVSMEEGSCGDTVDLIIRAPAWEAFEKDAEIRQAASYAEYHVRQAGCQTFQAFNVKGLVNESLVYQGVAARSRNWVPEGGILEGASREPTPSPAVGIYGPGSMPAREILEGRAWIEAPSLDQARCGPFELRDPFGSNNTTTLTDAITRLAGGNLDALIGTGGRYGKVLGDISAQRSEYNRHCQAAILLERDSLCTPADFACAVVSSCAQYAMPHVSDESRALFPSCIDTATRRVAAQRQRVLAARITAEDVETELLIAKLPGADERLGDWCGETLYATVSWPQGYRLTPSLARTVSDILNDSLTRHCPEAATVGIRVRRFTAIGSRRAYSGVEQFLRAYRESGAWNIAYHEDFLQQQRGQAYLESLFNTMKAMGSNPTSLGFAVAAGPLNAAMAAQQRDRFANYAREGKVCRMRDAVRHCYVSTTWVSGYGGRIGRTMITTSTPTRHSSCAAPCEFHNGYCNMETGARYPDAEAAERANCRDASSAEIEAAIAAANVSEQFPPYPYEIVYLPWDRIPED
jgi:hypothetical protein